MQIRTTLEPEIIVGAAQRIGLDVKHLDTKYVTHPKSHPHHRAIYVHTVTLKLYDPTDKDADYRKIHPHTHRRTASVCWHGHRDFLAEIYTHDPDAVVTSSYYVLDIAHPEPIRYTSRDNFISTHDATGDIVISSRAKPYLMREACACEDI